MQQLLNAIANLQSARVEEVSVRREAVEADFCVGVVVDGSCNHITIDSNKGPSSK